MDKVVTLSAEEYRRLLKNSEFLSYLEACGVDNWEGYDDARAMVEEDE